MAAKWLKNAVFYEIYPQSFLDTNGDGIVDGEDQHYSPDKKQGSDKEKKEAEHHRSFHR